MRPAPANMDVDGGMVIDVRVYRAAVSEPGSAWRDCWADAGVGVRLPQPFVEHRPGAWCEVMRPPMDWNVSRFLSRFVADPCLFSEITADVTHPTRGAFYAGGRTGSH
jgi:hypothetical protein